MGSFRNSSGAYSSRADVNVKNYGGYTPLHEICTRGLLEIAKELITAGADVNGMDSWGRTELYYAIKDGRLEIAELLKQYGATK